MLNRRRLIYGVIVGNVALAGLIAFVLRAPIAPRMVPISIDNPRNVGTHRFVERNGSGHIISESPIRSPKHDIEIIEYSVKVVPIAVLNDGTFECPEVHLTRPRFGMLGQVTAARQLESPWRIYSSGREEFLALSFDNRIDTYVFLLYGLSEDTGWRYVKTPVTEITTKARIDIPDMLTLPRLEEAPEHDRMWQTFQDAERRFNQRRK